MTDTHLRHIIIDEVKKYTKSYSSVVEADEWYDKQIAKEYFDKEVDDMVKFIPEDHNVVDEVNPEMYNALWEAADAYQTEYISSAAFSLVTLGVIANKPKALAVKAWIDSLWIEYYSRKADIENASLDFSSVGDMPHTIPELMGE